MKTSFPAPQQMAPDVWLIDLLEQGRPFRTGAYVICDTYPILIETGAANSHAALLAGLNAIGLRPTDLAYVAVTHVHLDHAGGAGQFMAKAPQAKLLVHPRGARHMADPSRLFQGASDVYGKRILDLFGPVQPVAAEQIQIQEHESVISTGKHELTFFDTPGHASHHFSIVDPSSDIIIAGDAAGLRFRKEFTGFSFDFVMPSTSPVDFDPDAVSRTMALFRQRPESTILHTHFGATPKAEALDETERLCRAFAAIINRRYDEDESITGLVGELSDLMEQRLTELGHHEFNLEAIADDFAINAMGLLHYERRRRRKLNAEASGQTPATGASDGSSPH
ncbi:Glyoxylase, beta-lactamase superfamily II [Alicyclobacillus hesperidum]|uniref:Glyoxylase, beta-lactamase superfamily II n=1 Tax=Alicyclobacillus hesperidum TaxID=89784 RepID=A0A1H2RKC5_9BACL|nr:MBL fold metallo-hydrolase [Alicyclobacillus hesperidum]SDW19871.1 Glyoxylase, beta-lactamase superfamily II [Alicyclobacillus hesperidum]